MNCPACGAENPEDKEFCGDCGEHLHQGGMPAEHESVDTDAPESEVPEPPTIPESPYVESVAIPHEQYAAASAPAYQPPAQPQSQAAQPYQVAQPTYAPAPPAAPPKKKTGLVIGIVAGVILLCVAGCCITLFFIPTDEETTTSEDGIVVQAEGERGKIEISEEQGFASSEDALGDVAEQYYRGGDWWYVEIAIEDDYEEYYITPDEATYDKGVILEKRDGEWFVTDVYTVDMSQVAVEEGSGGDASAATSDLAPEDAAALAVDGMLVAIMEGRLEDAYTFTTTPLSDYDLSVLTDTYTSWEFLGAEIQDDGSAVVIFTMYWADDTTENIGAAVMLEGDAWLVSDIGSAEE